MQRTLALKLLSHHTFVALLITHVCLYSTTSIAVTANHCRRDCAKDPTFAACPAQCYPAYEQSYYKVDNACVDFCLDYEHNLSECQQSCRN